MTPRSRILPPLLAALGLAACSDGDGPGGGTPGLRVVAGADAEDTIGAVLAQALVVEVRGASGSALRGVPVTFRTLEGTGSTGWTTRNALVARLDGHQAQWSVTDTTDSRGRAGALVVLGMQAGAASVRVQVPASGVDTVVTYTVKPGAAHRIALGPVDTALYVGATFALRAAVHDRGGNPRTDSVTVAAPAGSAVSTSARTVRGERFGRGIVVARAGALEDTARVSVVPAGVIVAYSPGSVQTERMVTMQLDGSGLRTLVAPQAGARPRWSPDGSLVAYVAAGQLRVVDMAGTVRTVHAGAPTLSEDYAPDFGASGQWIYATQTTDSTGIWRVRTDGSRIEKTGADWPQAGAPSTAPTGERFIYQTLAGMYVEAPRLRILDVATGERVQLDVPGQYPRWSPTGATIAYMDRAARIRLMSPDGSASRLLLDYGAHATFAWSPDGQWLVISSVQPVGGGYGRSGLSVVNVATGEVLPLRFGPELMNPDWRR